MKAVARIADRTILEVTHQKDGCLKSHNSLNSKILSELARLLCRAGADYQELDAASLKYINVFSPQTTLLFQVSATEDVDILREYAFPLVALDIEEYSKACWADFFKSYRGQVMLEIEVSRIAEANKVLGDYFGDSNGVFPINSCIRLRGLEKQEPWLVYGDTKRLKRKYGITLCLSPVNTFDMAGAICIEAMKGAADFITTSFCGKGEKGGWAALEEVVLASLILHGAKGEAETQVLSEAARLFSLLANEPIPEQKAVVGRAIFRCESGIHADGLYKNPSLYEPYPPEMTGHQREIVLGKHSGVVSLIRKLKELDMPVMETDKAREVLAKVRAKSVELKRFLYPDEVRRIIEEYDYWSKTCAGYDRPRECPHDGIGAFIDEDSCDSCWARVN